MCSSLFNGGISPSANRGKRAICFEESESQVVSMRPLSDTN